MNYEYIKGNNYLNYYTIELDNDLYSIFFYIFYPTNLSHNVQR